MAMHEILVLHLDRRDRCRTWPDGGQWHARRAQPAILTTDHESCKDDQPCLLLDGVPQLPLDLLAAGLLPVCRLADAEHRDPEELGLCLLWRTWFLHVAFYRSVQARELEFRQTWDQLAEMDAVPLRGSVQWARIHTEWVQAGRPGEPHDFILDRARWPGQEREERG